MLPRTRARRPYRPPIGMPPGREDWRVGSGVSLLVHLVILVLVLAPLAVTDLSRLEQGAGGAGPAGGGGGGNRGSGALRAELLRFVRIAAAEPAVVAPPTVQPLPPQPVPEPRPTLVAEAEPPVLKAIDPTMPIGVGGGTGSDSLGGSGPGSGGGVGSGVGSGRGSGVGPGTGGGTQANYPPTPTEMFIPPLPTPESVRGFKVVAEFDIDETGRILSLTFTETPDRGYNRRLREVLRGFRFRPGTTPDGTPVRMKYQISIDLP